jgi:hypothetical protein
MKSTLKPIKTKLSILALAVTLYGCSTTPELPSVSQQSLIDEGLLATECSVANVTKSKSHDHHSYDDDARWGWCILSKDKKSLVHTDVFRGKTYRKTYALDEYGSIAIETIGPTIFSLMLGETSYQYQFNSKKLHRYRLKKDGDILVRPSKILVMNLSEEDKKKWSDVLQTMDLPIHEATQRYTDPYRDVIYNPIFIYKGK